MAPETAHPDDSVVLVLTTWPVDGHAEAAGRVLVDERLAACVSILPVMTSVYRWQGRVESASERQMVLKTTRDRVEALRSRLLALHPYDVPEFLVVPASDGSEAYLQWVRAETREQ